MNNMPADIVITFFASFFIYIMFGGLLILWIIDGKIKKEQVLHAVFAALLAFLISSLIKELFPTLRPYIVNGEKTNVFLDPIDAAFPSSHTAEAFAVAVTVFMHDRKVGWGFLTAALTVGVARVIANVHYPVDIVGGALLGTIIAVVIEKTHLLGLVNDLSGRQKNIRKNKK